jgi:uncharacterized protein (DUF488 family)
VTPPSGTLCGVKAAKTIHMAGLGSRSVEALAGMLGRTRVRTVVDVRRYPGSERHGHLDARVLHPALAAAGYDVLDLGDLLGGDRPGGFPRYMRTGGFARGLDVLERAAALAGSAVVLCAERDHRRCHRRFLAEALEARGWTVVHHEATTQERAARGDFRLVGRAG